MRIAHRRSVRRATIFTSLFSIALATFTSLALADDIFNTVDGSIDAAAESMTLTAGGTAGSTTISIQPRNGDSVNGCNVKQDGTLTIALHSSAGAVATIQPAELTFASCSAQSISVTPLTAGSSRITASIVSNNTGGTFVLDTATFNVTVNAPANTAPVVSVGGVTNGATYAKGSAPTASCSVSDAEDSNESATPTLSPITGTNSADGLGSQTATCSYTDGGNLTRSATATYTIDDQSAPTVGYTLTPSAPNGDNGWYRGDVSLTWAVTELQSPISLQLNGCSNQAIVTDQLATSYSCSALSAGGPAGPVTVTIKRDASAPTVSCAPLPTGWVNDNVSRSCTSADNGPSGLADPNADASFSLSTDVAPGTETDAASFPNRAVFDMAGNSTSVPVATVRVDRKAPTLSGAPVGSPNAAGWYRSSVTIDWSCADGGSGVTCPADTTLHGDAEGLTSSASVTDGVGHTTAATSTPPVNIDATAPTGHASYSALPNLADWYQGPVTISWNCSDNLSGVVEATCTPSTLASEGANQAASRTFSDAAGNQATRAVSGVNIDLTDPTLSLALLGTKSAFDWYRTPVTVDWTCSDAPSGLPVDSCPDDTLNEGAGQSRSMTVTDRAGRSATLETGTVDVDLTAPTYSASVPAAIYDGWYDADVPVTWNCADALSGISPAGACPDSTVTGEGVALSVGSTATDKAGNTTAMHKGGIKIDRTAPTLGVSLNGATANGAGWFNSPVRATWTCDDAGGSGLADSCPEQTFGEGADQPLDTTVHDNVGHSTRLDHGTISVDLTRPTARPSVPDAIYDGWYADDVTVTWNCSDALSGLAGSCANAVIRGEGSTLGATTLVTDIAGNSDTFGVSGIKIDRTAPTFDRACPTSLTYGETFSVNVSDGAGSGRATAAAMSYTASTLASSFELTARDNVGNSRTLACTDVAVRYGWTGFLQPINDTAHQVSVGQSKFKLGSNVPVKLRLLDASQRNVAAGAAPTFERRYLDANCDMQGATEFETAAGVSTGQTFKWDAASSQYHYNFSTKGLAAGEYRIYARLDDGTMRPVDICLTK